MRQHSIQLSIKRCIDILFSLVLLVLLLPVFSILSILIRLGSRGGAFYRQTRVGRNGRLFTVVKFRTMAVDAESKGPVWSIRDDPRVTPLGGVLRRTGMDELPQLWNILMGDMSLVGPRPERPVFAARFEREVPRYGQRHAMRPGITGWAQVHGFRGDTSISERTRYDVEYVRNWSLLLDLRILLRTPFILEFRNRTRGEN